MDGMLAATPAAAGPDLDSYDRILVCFSGGKDSLALVLHLIEQGVPRHKIELHHHDIDGRGPTFMDWACTPAYCRAVAEHLGVPLYFSWREGGFLRELTKVNARSAPVFFERPDGSVGQGGGIKGSISTRVGFPQQTADLKLRWCSGSGKVDVMAIAITNQPRFIGQRILVLTGERAQESASRAKRQTFTPHRTHAQKRHVDQWLPIHAWSAEEVWAIIRRHGIVPHLAYQLGWSRLSCMTCIFASPNQWATIRLIFPARFAMIAEREAATGLTIRVGFTVSQQADRGTPYPAATSRQDLCAMAERVEWTLPIAVVPEAWAMPAGAFAENAGPC